MNTAEDFWRAELEILEAEAEARRKRSDAALDEMFKKGGRASFSLRNGSRICPNGSEPTEVSKPMTDVEWEDYKRLMGIRHVPNSKTAICLPYTD